MKTIHYIALFFLILAIDIMAGIQTAIIASLLIIIIKILLQKQNENKNK